LQRWKEVIQGNAYQTKHGYYCVRLPDESERSRNITRAEFFEIADAFFNGTAPWNEITDRRRFGIPNFVSDISKLLVQLIENALPKLKEDVNRLLAECQRDLSKLPEPLSADPATEILSRITKFCTDLDGVVNGQKDKSLVQRNRERYALFKTNIQATAPDFRPFINHESYSRPSFDGDECDVERGPGVETFSLDDVRQLIKE
jgi:hypothetical protein